jgi:hypothetical protein
VVVLPTLPHPYRIRTPIMEKPHEKTMPGRPTHEGKRCITLELDGRVVDHLDEQAAGLGCSRAFYVRQLFLKDMKRQTPAEVRV